MGGRLYTSTSLDDLADRLIEHLGTSAADPFEPAWVIAPHRLTEAWLRRRVARQLGVAMNLRIDFPERGFWEAVALADPEPPAEDTQPLGRSELEMGVAAALATSPADDEALRPLLGYLRGDGEPTGPRYWRRLWQISRRVVEGYLDYEQHLPDMVKGWLRGQLTRPTDALEAAQAELYRRLADDSQPGRTLGRYAFEALPRIETRPDALPAELHVFGLSLYSPLQIEILHTLAQVLTIRLYHAPPLDPVALEDSEAPEGEAGRVMRQWTKAPRLVWHRLREGLVEPGRFEWVALAGPSGGTPFLTVHEPVRVLEAPTIHREAEAIHADIVARMADPSLRLDEIAVLVADPEEYLPALLAVFERATPRLPFNLLGGGMGSASAYGSAVAGLLKLAAGRLDRDQVLALAANPCFLARHGLTREDVMVWRQWTESLGVFHSWDAEGRAASGYGASPRFTWRQGLRRLRLGQVMAVSPDEDLPPSPFDHYVPYRDLETSDREAVAAFDMAVESVLRMVEGWTRPGTGRTATRWAEDLRLLLDASLSVPEDRPEEAAVMAEVRDALSQLDELGRSLGDRPVGLELVEEVVLSRVRSIDARIGSPLDGVTIAPLSTPLRVPPFRVVYIAGMGEMAFPGTAPVFPLDLRPEREGAHALSLPDQNLALGLEAFGAAREVLCIGYLGRDLQKDEPKFPSPMIAQLGRLLGTDGPVAEIERLQVPLHASSREYLTGDADLKTYDVWEQALGWLWHARREGRALSPALADSVAAEAAKRTQVRRPSPAEPPLPSAVERVTLDRLTRFLEEPLTESLRRHLRLTRDAIDEATLETREPLQATFPHDHLLHVGCLGQLVNRLAGGESITGADLEDMARREYDRLALRGHLPEGALGSVDQERLVEGLTAAGATLAAGIADRSASDYVPRLIVGGAATKDVPGSRVPPTTLPLGGDAVVELRGSGEHWWLGPDAVHVLCITSRSKAERTEHKGVPVFPRYVFGPFLLYCALLASDDPGARELVEGKHLVVEVLTKAGPTCYDFQDLTVELARGYLAALCAEALDRRRFELLPFGLVSGYEEAWHGFAQGMDEAEYRGLLMGLVETDPDSFSPTWHRPERLGLLRDLPAYVPEEPLATLDRRIGLLYRAHVAGGE
ncbi:MAG: hypothetical protein GF320_11935 [Armatimonadia bacterium]|nr:hypothetical protein [Armatimonadia bacterium]